MTTVAEFAIESTQVLGPHGKVVATLPEFARDTKQLVELYRAIVLTRTFDPKAIALQRTGRLGTYASSLGQGSACSRRLLSCSANCCAWSIIRTEWTATAGSPCPWRSR